MRCGNRCLMGDWVDRWMVGEYMERWMAVDSGKMDRPLTGSVGGRMNGQGKKDRRMGRWRERCVWEIGRTCDQAR